MTISFVPHTSFDNTNEPIEMMLGNKNNEHSISLDSVDYNIHNNKKSNTYDTLNHAKKKSPHTCDSLQMKTPNECNTPIPVKKKAEVSGEINSNQDTITKENDKGTDV